MRDNVIRKSKIKRRDDATIVNQQIGNFFVLDYAYSKNQQRHFRCQCILCGTIKILPKGQIKYRRLKSCGCAKSYKNMEEIFQKNTKNVGGCLQWTGTITCEGYGRFR